MKVLLATLCLNEMQWLPLLYRQHRDWPDLVSWVFVESADRVFAQANPDHVNPQGLSVDGTTEFLQQLAATDPRVLHIPYGFSTHQDPAQGKCDSRQRYLDAAERIAPDLVVILDADEFYTLLDQKRINALFQILPQSFRALRLAQRDIWLPPSLPQKDLFRFEVRGGYWAVPHTRFWRWEPGLRYRHNHNWPEDTQGRSLVRSQLSLDTVRPAAWRRYEMRLGIPQAGIPQCVHMAFASDVRRRQAKHRYYQARGEGVTDRRQMYVACRAAFETWKPGDTLPHGATVVPYGGPIPEVFRVSHDECACGNGRPTQLPSATEPADDPPGLVSTDRLPTAGHCGGQS